MNQRNMELTPASGSMMRATRWLWFFISFLFLISGTTYIWWGLQSESEEGIRLYLIVGSAMVLFGLVLLGRTLMLNRIPAGARDGASET